MVSRRPPQLPPIEIKEFISPTEIDRAIQKLSLRLEEVKKLDPSKIRYDDQEVSNIEDRISDSILEVFGRNSPEYRRHGHYHFGDFSSPYETDQEKQKDFALAIPKTATLLEGLSKTWRRDAPTLYPIQQAGFGRPLRDWICIHGLQPLAWNCFGVVIIGTLFLMLPSPWSIS